MTDLATLQRDLDRLESVVEAWGQEQRLTVDALRRTVEAIQAEAFRRLIASVKEDPAGLTALRGAVNDPFVFSVLDYHGLLRAPEPPLEARIEKALDSVRPMLAKHEGNVQLVRFEPPNEVLIRLTGSCDGCAVSEITVKLGVEKALIEQVDEVEKVTVVKGRAPVTDTHTSPFATPWEDTLPVDEVPTGSVKAFELERASVLLTRVGGEYKAYPNACAHLGMPLEMAEVRDGIITCTYHGFQFRLDTGECLTAPEIALPSFPVREHEGRVQVQVTT